MSEMRGGYLSALSDFRNLRMPPAYLVSLLRSLAGFFDCLPARLGNGGGGPIAGVGIRPTAEMFACRTCSHQAIDIVSINAASTSFPGCTAGQNVHQRRKTFARLFRPHPRSGQLLRAQFVILCRFGKILHQVPAARLCPVPPRGLSLCFSETNRRLDSFAVTESFILVKCSHHQSKDIFVRPKCPAPSRKR